ncbi:MAG: class I adenylate-forming enzyme family protein [Acidimicrobiales bacterium]
MLLAICLPLPEAAAAIRSAWDSGWAVAPLDPRAPEPERARALDAIRPTHVLDGTGEHPWLGGQAPPPDVAAVVLTSGTTGHPLAVELTWSGLEASAAAVRQALGTTSIDRWLCCLPLHHVGGLAVVGRAWASRVPVTELPRFDVDAVASANANLVSLVPTQVRRLIAADVDLTRFRHILVGGTAVSDDVRALPNVIPTYGLTETWGGVVHDGHPLEGVTVDLAPDGTILLLTPTVMRGYRLDDAATADAFTGEGYLRTGDVGRWAPDGRLEIVDRRRDLVISGGVNVSPTEVEAVLARHPRVADVAVAGAADDEWGQRVVAFVVPEDPADPPTLEQLRRFARKSLAPSKLPRQVQVVAQIPRTPGGKAIRRLLIVPPTLRPFPARDTRPRGLH